MDAIPSPRAVSWLSLSLILLSTAACARECTPQLRGGWIRMVPGDMAMMAGFGRVENHCPTPATIVAASSPAFGDTTLHESTLVDGISRMRPVPALRIAADGAAVFQPGGLHLMLMDPTTQLQPGGKVTVRFTLRDGRTIDGDFELRKPGD